MVSGFTVPLPTRLTLPAQCNPVQWQHVPRRARPAATTSLPSQSHVLFTEKGDRIRFTVFSDQSDEVHVHGYDLDRPVGPDVPARFSFTADADGIFEVEPHGSGAQIASWEVLP